MPPVRSDGTTSLGREIAELFGEQETSEKEGLKSIMGSQPPKTSFCFFNFLRGRRRKQDLCTGAEKFMPSPAF